MQRILLERGADEATAALTGHLALAVCTYARGRAEGDVGSLGVGIEEALDQLP